ncbi:MAG: hypothetical protein K0S44_2961 [Bacteroidetes bacterium]|jgi:hypothetical protein|nr:hypothetical protein [Bacteroidota bacterium]
MKTRLLLLFLSSFAVSNCFSQAQPQGEYHKHIVKKTDDERKATKSKEWWGAGVIMFSKQDIPRTGSIKETEAMLSNTFNADEKFVGRVYLPRAVNKMDAAPPEALTYRVYIEGIARPFVVGVAKDVMPEGDWSSWLLDFPDNFQTAMSAVPEGTHKVKIEVWSSKEVETTIVYTDENDKAVAYSKDTDNKGKFWAAGEFTLVK